MRAVCFFFFFQAEDGIRDADVTGVQTCALPISLTIALGTLLALALTGITNIWFALIVGAALAPTDAALGAGMMANPVVPARIRRLINVESGLNDGIATPFVSVALAGAGTAEHVVGITPAVAAAELAHWHCDRRGRGRRGWRAGERHASAWLGRRRLRRFGGAGAGAVRVRVRTCAARQWFHRRVHRRARVRHHRRPARSAARAVRGGGGCPGVAAGLAQAALRAGRRWCRTR